MLHIFLHWLSLFWTLESWSSKREEVRRKPSILYLNLLLPSVLHFTVFDSFFLLFVWTYLLHSDFFIRSSLHVEQNILRLKISSLTIGLQWFTPFKGYLVLPEVLAFQFFPLNGPVSAFFCCWLHTHLWEANPPSFSKFWKYRFFVKGLFFLFFSLFPLTSGKAILVTHSCLQISQKSDSYPYPLYLKGCMANHKILTNQKKIPLSSGI